MHFLATVSIVIELDQIYTCILCALVCVCVCVYIYIYIYRKRERERENVNAKVLIKNLLGSTA